MCRLVECDIGGYQEIQEAIAAADVEILAQRIRQGVLAFGRDGDIRKTFEPFGIGSFDTHPFSSARLRRETGERALVREALFTAISRQPRVRVERRGRSTFLLPEDGQVDTDVFNSGDVKAVDRIAGVVTGTSVRWSEACRLRIDHRLDRIWLLLEPTILSDLPDDPPTDLLEATREFTRERRARRHNRMANALLEGWISLICGDEQEVRVRTYDIGDGVDAEFQLLRISGFSGPLAQ